MSASVNTLPPQKNMINVVSYFNDNDDQKMVMNKGMENGINDIIEVNDANENKESNSSSSSSSALQQQQLENCKDDRCLQQHLGKINVCSKPDKVVDAKPGVEIVRIAINCRGRPDIVLSQPYASTPKACLFSLKEGSRYRLRFSFIVSNKAVSGLKYVNTLWKAGVRVDKSVILLGSFDPNEQAYSYELEEDTAPSGIFVRGLYCARTKVVDDHDNCFLDIKYYFEIQKTWPASTT